MNFVILLAVAMLLFVSVDLVVDLDEFLEAGQYHAVEQKVDAVAEEFGVDRDDLLFAVDDNYAGVIAADYLNTDIENADAAINAAQPERFGVIWGSIYKIADFYGPTIVVVYVYVSGLIVAAAMGFTLTNLQRNRELIAFAASGISLYRVALPLVMSGVVLTGATLPLQEFVIPKLAPKLIRTKPQAKYTTISTFSQYLVPDGDGALFSTRAFDASRNEVKDMVVHVRDDQGVTVERWTADLATWNSERIGWDLIGQAYVVVPQRETETIFDPGSLTQVNFLPTELSPTVLLARRAESYSGLLSLRELQLMQRNKAVPDGLRSTIIKTIWSRFSLMVVNALLLLIALPGFLKLYADSPLNQAARGSALVLGAWAGSLVLMQLDVAGLNPVATAWFPVLVMLPAAFAMLQRVKT